MEKKIEEKFFVFEIIASELVNLFITVKNRILVIGS